MIELAKRVLSFNSTSIVNKDTFVYRFQQLVRATVLKYENLLLNYVNKVFFSIY